VQLLIITSFTPLWLDFFRNLNPNIVRSMKKVFGYLYVLFGGFMIIFYLVIFVLTNSSSAEIAENIVEGNKAYQRYLFGGIFMLLPLYLLYNIRKRFNSDRNLNRTLNYTFENNKVIRKQDKD